jgi:FkbM family methyltransferase
MLRLLKTGILSLFGKLGYAVIKLPKAAPIPSDHVAGDFAAKGVAQRKGEASRTVGDRGIERLELEVRPKSPELKKSRINFHHIGGRGGGFPFPLAPQFYDGTEMYIYDADPDCEEQMESAASYVDHVIVAAVGGADKSDTFRVNYDPFTSSLLPPHPDNGGIFFQDASCDYLLSDVLRPVKQFSVETRTIGSLAREHGFQVDYFSLDVQGAEFDILAGASESVLRDTVGIMCEISFLQFYNGQKLFDEITLLLRGKGFFVANIFPHGFDWATNRTAVGWRGTGFTAHGDVLFMRDPRHVLEYASSPFGSLFKQAFVAMCYGNIAFALQCLDLAYKSPDTGFLAAGKEISYIRFLDEMYRLYLKVPHLYPPRFVHLWTAEESLARFSGDGKVTRDIQNVRRAYFSQADKMEFLRLAPRFLEPSPTDFEELLDEYGFSELAEDVRERRIVSMKQTLGTLGYQLVAGQIVDVPPQPAQGGTKP